MAAKQGDPVADAAPERVPDLLAVVGDLRAEVAEHAPLLCAVLTTFSFRVVLDAAA